MRVRHGVPLAQLTTIGLGGPAETVIDVTADDETIAALNRPDAAGRRLLVLAGGSNTVVADDGFRGVVLRMAARGITASRTGGRVRLAVAAGEPWGGVVAAAAAERLSGIECLAGIPGTAGATPIQNVGAYGQQVSDVVVSVRAYDRRDRRVVEIGRDRCRFGYRTSAFRGSARFVVLGVTLELEPSRLARPIAHAELARMLGVQIGSRPPLGQVGEAVLDLRRRKGMVLDPADPDSVSAGSFFLNPSISGERFAELERRVAARLGRGTQIPAWPSGEGGVKTSAAWLIERAGFRAGFGTGRVGLSSRHTLALVNRGGASTAELVALARRIRLQVDRSFGVVLRAEPALVGVRL